ncbi:MAG TPA: N-acetylmuramoyl-L-alanine amidase [Xanthobacteraceae bacterium]|nr:N-acetylmuramoyl-L-alanine amidase [Xanthobacteraceae bacterium]
MSIRATCLLAAICAAWLAAGAVPAGAVDRAAPPRPPSEDYPVATEARLLGDETRTRFVVELTRTVELSAFTLADPYRVVIDVPQVVFRLPAKAGETGRGLVKAFRFGLVMQGGSRIVLDVAGPVRVDKAFVLDPVDEQPARLVIDLVAIDRDSFLRNLAIENQARRAAAAPAREREPAAKSADPRPLVVIDPGHGGLDSGTVARSGETEKTIVLDFALKLRDRLEKTGKYRVALTRTDDHFVPLAERVRLARAGQAALLISIHADALIHRDPEGHGATVYTLSETASDEEAARLADTENRADLIAGVDLTDEPGDVADILIDLAQRETKAFSMQFARALVNEFKLSGRLHKRPLKSAGFRVLKAPDVPSVLIELGFVTNPQDLKLLTSDAWRSRAADSMVQAVQTFFTTRVAGAGAAAGSN